MWPNLQFPADLVTFTVEICNGKLHFLCSVRCDWKQKEVISEIAKLQMNVWMFVSGGEMVGRNKYGPLISPTVLWIISVWYKNPSKKLSFSEIFASYFHLSLKLFCKILVFWQKTQTSPNQLFSVKTQTPKF